MILHWAVQLGQADCVSTGERHCKDLSESITAFIKKYVKTNNLSSKILTA